MDKKEFGAGRNCAQAVLCSYCDEAGLTDAQAMELAKPFGGGRMTKCGAVLAAEVVLDNIGGFKNKADILDFDEETLKTIEEFEAKFKDMNTTTICSKLKGTNGQPKLRSCAGCVEDSIDILCKILNKNEDLK